MALSVDDMAKLEAVRRGDEAAFAALVEDLQAVMTRVALSFVRNPATAEEVVQDAWLGFLEGLDRFEGRTSLRGFLCAIVANQARTRSVRDARVVPDPTAGEAQPGAPSAEPEGRLLAGERQAVVLGAIRKLPGRQRAVVLLHDVHGLSPAEICALLGVSEGNRRVLLHRARAAVRAALEAYSAEEQAA